MTRLLLWLHRQVCGRCQTQQRIGLTVRCPRRDHIERRQELLRLRAGWRER